MQSLQTLMRVYAPVLAQLPALRAEVEGLFGPEEAPDAQTAAHYEAILQEASTLCADVALLPEAARADARMVHFLDSMRTQMQGAMVARFRQRFAQLSAELEGALEEGWGPTEPEEQAPRSLYQQIEAKARAQIEAAEQLAQFLLQSAELTQRRELLRAAQVAEKAQRVAQVAAQGAQVAKMGAKAAKQGVSVAKVGAEALLRARHARMEAIRARQQAAQQAVAPKPPEETPPPPEEAGED